MNFSDYQLEQDGLIVCEPCLSINLFSDTDLGAPDAPAMLGPYEAFLASFKEQLNYCILDGNQMHAKVATPALLQVLPNEMNDHKRRKKGGIYANYRHGKTRNEVRAPSFEFDYSKIGQPHTAIRIRLPLAWFDQQGLLGINRFLTESIKAFDLQAGYVGYCFAWKYDFDSPLEPYFLRWLQRHPGLMAPSFFAQANVSYHGLIDIGWITLLGAKFVERMGGPEGLAKATRHVPGIAYESFPHGAVGLRIGDAPRLGDTLDGDPMNDYRALGKVLAPLRNAEAIVKSMTVTGHDDREHPGLRAKWINRFFSD